MIHFKPQIDWQGKSASHKQLWIKVALMTVCFTSVVCLYFLNGIASPGEEKKEATHEAKVEAKPAGKEAPASSEASAPAEKAKDGPATAITDIQINDNEKPVPLNLVTKDSALYVDLAREIEFSERERAKLDALKDKNTNLKMIEGEMQARLQELDTLQGKLSQKAGEVGGEIQKGQDSNQNLQLLVSLYESLSAEQASQLLIRLPIPVTVKMMQLMNPKKTSKILAAMEPKIAADLSQRLIRTASADSAAVPQ